MAIYLPGPPISYPTPPPPTVTLKSAASKSTSKSASKVVDYKYQVLFLINPTEATVEFTIETTKTIKLGKVVLNPSDKKTFIVKPKSLFNITLVNTFKVKPEYLTVKDDAGKKATYWSLLDVAFAKPKTAKKA